MTTLRTNSQIGPSSYARKDGGQWVVVVWLAAVSASFGLAVTVSLFDRTTLSGVSRLWLASAAVCFASSFVWWVRPRFQDGRLRLAFYETTSLISLTLPLILGAAGCVLLVYTSDGIHGYVYHQFYYERLLSKSYWPVMDFAMGLYLCVLVWALRGILLRLGSSNDLRTAVATALLESTRALPVGLLAIGLLLATVSLTMINVNFFRYWATADGLSTLGHYIYTFTDRRQVELGGLPPLFISFPLLPVALVASFGLLGHNTFAGYLPIILASSLLPLLLFLTMLEITGNRVLSFVLACVTAAFPFLRSYTLDVGEADGLLIASVVFAAYLQLRATRANSSARTALIAGVAMGVAAIARPEGILYTAAMVAAGLKGGWKRRNFWLSVTGWLVVMAGFSMASLRDLGELWPGNHSGTIKLSNFADTVQVLQGAGVFGRYANALGMTESVLTVLSVLILLLVVLSSIQMLRKDFRLVWIPVTALGNVVMVFFVGPVPAEATKYHDFFRHISYGFPLLGITLAYGANEGLGFLRGRWRRSGGAILSAALALLVLTELLVLEAPVRPYDTVRNSLLSEDVHVTAAKLLSDPYPLETIKFRRSGSFYVPDDEQYLRGYPDNVNSYYASADIRQFDNPADYYTAAEMLFIGFLVLAAAPSIATVLSSLHGADGRVADSPSSGVTSCRFP